MSITSLTNSKLSFKMTLITKILVLVIIDILCVDSQREIRRPFKCFDIRSTIYTRDQYMKCLEDKWVPLERDGKGRPRSDRSCCFEFESQLIMEYWTRVQCEVEEPEIAYFFKDNMHWIETNCGNQGRPVSKEYCDSTPINNLPEDRETFCSKFLKTNPKAAVPVFQDKSKDTKEQYNRTTRNYCPIITLLLTFLIIFITLI